MFKRMNARTIVIVGGFLFAVLLYFILPNTSGVTSGVDIQRRFISGTLTIVFLVAVVWLVKDRK